MLANKRLTILLISIILLAIIGALSLGERDKLTWPEKFVKDTVSVFQRIIYKPTHAVVGFFKNVSDIYYLYEENKILKSNLVQFSQLQASYEILSKENQRLREMLNAKSTLNNYKLRIAEVIARDHASWYNVLTIDKGEKHGVKKNMAVITPDGLIGIVQDVSYFSANIRLLTDIEQSNYVSAMVLGNEDTFGIVESYDIEKKRLILRKIPLESPIEPGQVVVTSGLGSVFPRGILIGKVTEVLPGDHGLTKMAYVEPSADFYRFDEVFIVERAFDQDETDEDLANPAGVNNP